MEKKKKTYQTKIKQKPLRPSADILLVDIELYVCGHIMEEIKLYISGLGDVIQ